MPETAADPLTRRTPEAKVFYNLQTHDFVSFSPQRPVIIGRRNPLETGISLEYSHTGGRAWHILSTHNTIHEAIDAFYALPLGKDSDPRHYRILKES